MLKKTIRIIKIIFLYIKTKELRIYAESHVSRAKFLIVYKFTQ